MQQVMFNPGDRLRTNHFLGEWITILDEDTSSKARELYGIHPSKLCFRVDGINYTLDKHPYNCHSKSAESLNRQMLEYIPFGKDYDPSQQPYDDGDI